MISARPRLAESRPKRRDVEHAYTIGEHTHSLGFRAGVKDLDAFAKRLDALGIHFDVAPRPVPDSKTRVSFLTDPWGTYIEVTENLAPAP